MSVELLDALSQEILTLKETISFLESREVCGAAHDNVETCGYCQRDAVIAALRKYGAHHDSCMAKYPPECSCGFWQALHDYPSFGSHS